MRVSLIVPNRKPYPYEAIVYGLKTLGVSLANADPSRSDFLITWTPWLGSSRSAKVKSFGKHRSIIMENGFLSPIKNKKYYQVALDGWNASADFPKGDSSRASQLGIESREVISHMGPMLLLGQSGHLSDRRTAPRNWAEKTHFNLRDRGEDVILRRKGESRPLIDDLNKAGSVYTWSSNSACWAILAGIPVYHASEAFAMRDFSAFYDIEHPKPDPVLGDPSSLLNDLSWLQWNEEELATGLPFKRIFDYAHSRSIQE